MSGVRLFLLLTCVGLALAGCDSADKNKPSDSDNSNQTNSGTSQGTQKTKSTTDDLNQNQSQPRNKSDISSIRAQVVPQFQDRAKALGIDFTFYTDMVPGRYFLPEIMCGGLAWFDYDLDGHPDLYITNGSHLKDPDPSDFTHTHRFYRNLAGSKFDDITSRARLGHNGYGQGLAAGDFNSDGFMDLLVTCYGENQLYVNNGDGTFDNVTHELHSPPPLWSTGAVFMDVDDDGDLDLFVANYMHVNWQTHKTCTFGGKPGYCGPGDYESQPDWLFLNNGEGSFTESAEALGFVGERGNGLAIAWADFDDDRIPELYVANDMAPNYLFARKSKHSKDAESTFYIDVAGQAGCAVSGNGQNEASMGIALADYDADGLPDLYLTHYYHHKNTLYHNLGGMLFEDDSYRSRVAALSHERLGFGCVAFDYDRDGASDIFVANGHVLGPENDPYQMLPTLVRNVGRARFDDVSSSAGDYFKSPKLGRGVASADFDSDGNLDIAITHLDDPIALLKNETKQDRNWLGIILQTSDRKRPVGARIMLQSGKSTQVSTVWDGGSYYSVADGRLLFGLPEDGDLKLEIAWPDGTTTEYRSLSANAYWIIHPERQPRRWEPDLK